MIILRAEYLNFYNTILRNKLIYKGFYYLKINKYNSSIEVDVYDDYAQRIGLQVYNYHEFFNDWQF